MMAPNGISTVDESIHLLSNVPWTETEETDDEKDGRSYGSLMMERLTGTRDGRIDHMLQVEEIMMHHHSSPN